jgi:CHAD domain-containing protein
VSAEATGDRLTAETLVRESAAAFAEWVRASAEKPHKKKPVHQLRTNARRLEATLGAMKPLLRLSVRREARDEVRGLRRLASPVRDADVMRGLLEQRLPRAHDASQIGALGYLIGRLGAQRDIAGEALARATNKAGTRVETLADRIASGLKREKDGRTFGAVAGEAIRDASLEFAAASEQDLTDLELLHEMRKSGKRVRYTVEIFKPILPQPLAGEVETRLKDCQARLGGINDRHEQVLLIDRALARKDSASVRRGLERLRADIAGHLERDHTSFVRWWWDVGAAQQLLGCAHELAVVRSEAAVA